MNRDKKIQIARQQAFDILMQLKNEKCFDGYVTRFFTPTKCLNYLGKMIPEYFKVAKTLKSWNKDTWFNIFEDKELSDALVWYMKDFNFSKEIEENEDK